MEQIGKESVGLPDSRGAGDGDMICAELQPAPMTTSRPTTQYGPISASSGDLRAGVDDGGGVNHSRPERIDDERHLSTNPKSSSASDTTSSLTRHLHAALPRRLLDAQHFAMDEKRVAGKDRLPEFHVVRAHEVADFSRVLRSCASSQCWRLGPWLPPEAPRASRDGPGSVPENRVR